MWRSYEKTKDILRPRSYLKFPSVRVIVKEIAYKALKHQKNSFSANFWGRAIAIPFLKFFHGLPACNMDKKHVPTDQCYQSHRPPSDLDTYKWRYWTLKEPKSSKKCFFYHISMAIWSTGVDQMLPKIWNFNFLSKFE